MVSTRARTLLLSAALHGAVVVGASLLILGPPVMERRAAWLQIDLPAAEEVVPEEEPIEHEPVPLPEEPEQMVQEQPIDEPHEETEPEAEPETEVAEAPDPLPVPPRRQLTAEEWLSRVRVTPPEPPPEVPAPVVVEPSPCADQNQPPTYPWIALRRGWEGTVVVQLTIAPDGTVKCAKVVESSGHRCLDEAARAQLATWRFAPGTRDGARVEMPFRQPVVFNIRG